MKRFRAKLTYANVVATIALFGMLAGGGAYAASKIGSKDIAKGAVKAKHIKKKAVKGKHLSESARKGLEGRRGPAGPAGPAGAQGPAGLVGPMEVAVSEEQFVGPGVETGSVDCPDGTRVISGGGEFDAVANDLAIIRSVPSENLDGWELAVFNGRTDDRGFFVYAICAAG